MTAINLLRMQGINAAGASVKSTVPIVVLRVAYHELHRHAVALCYLADLAQVNDCVHMVFKSRSIGWRWVS